MYLISASLRGVDPGGNGNRVRIQTISVNIFDIINVIFRVEFVSFLYVGNSLYQMDLRTDPRRLHNVNRKCCFHGISQAVCHLYMDFIISGGPVIDTAVQKFYKT